MIVGENKIKENFIAFITNNYGNKKKTKINLSVNISKKMMFLALRLLKFI
jgi:hypothetical protein